METKWDLLVFLFSNATPNFTIYKLFIIKIGIEFSEDSVNLHLHDGDNQFEVYLAPGFLLRVHNDSFSLYINGNLSVSN